MTDSGIYIKDVAHLREALGLLGSLIDATHDEVAIAIIGGSALLLDGSVTRVTRDVDVVAFVEGEDLRAEATGADVFARHVLAVALELGLDPGWLNLGPVGLLDAGLPQGFLARCRVEDFGALRVYIANRYDLIHTKLYAAVDQGPTSKHMSDLLALAPTPAELDAARAWCCIQDVSAPFAAEVDAAVSWVRRGSDG